jgi:hypothetical protein
MCAVSMISEHYYDWETARKPFVWPPTLPPRLPWTPEAFADLKEILRRLDELDKKLGLEHCEDPKKAEWMQQIEERLRLLEQHATAR